MQAPHIQFDDLATCNHNHSDNDLNSPTTKPLLPCKHGVLGSPTGHSGHTKVSKTLGAELLLSLTSSAPATRGQAGEEIT